jgi:prephenate dehydrogenase
MFVEALEVDSFMAALHILPQLSAAALVKATIRQPGWQDGRKLTGRPFAEQTRTVSRDDTPAAVAAAALQSRDHTLRVLDNLIHALYELRDAVNDQNEQELTSLLQDASAAFYEWLGDRLQGQWSAREIGDKQRAPSAGEMFGQMFGIRPKDKSKDKRR